MNGGVTIPDKDTARALNDLARHKAIVRILSDIRMDMEICEIEGWDKNEYGITNCIGIVNHDIPSVQPERKTGHWIAPKYYPTKFTYTCSECGYKQSFNGKFKFCPNCGVDMRGGTA